jgi:hypothetical protein
MALTGANLGLQEGEAHNKEPELCRALETAKHVAFPFIFCPCTQRGLGVSYSQSGTPPFSRFSLQLIIIFIIMSKCSLQVGWHSNQSVRMNAFPMPTSRLQQQLACKVLLECYGTGGRPANRRPFCTSCSLMARCVLLRRYNLWRHDIWLSPV